MKPKIDYIDINRKMWEFTADIYRSDGYLDTLERVQRTDFTTFDEIKQYVFDYQIDIKGKNVIQIGCNNGVELINLKKIGANHCLGIDISEKFIEQAKQFSNVSGYVVEFEPKNVYDIDETYFGKFDLVYITVGVLGWMPQISIFFEIVSNLLVKQGKVFIYEQHPILGMFNPEPEHQIDASYFRKVPFEDDIVPEYIDKEGRAKATSYWFPYTMSDILNSCINNGLQVNHLGEYSKDISETYKALENDKIQYPMSFTLILNKG